VLLLLLPPPPPLPLLLLLLLLLRVFDRQHVAQADVVAAAMGFKKPRRSMD
jgi:hypothetical protein